jgi:hypothetical protein
MALARQWGGGDVASVDGLRFIVPVRTINAGPNPHYFHYGAGVTLYSFVSNQFTGFHHMVIPGTDRDSFYILGGPIDNVTPALRIDEFIEGSQQAGIPVGDLLAPGSRSSCPTCRQRSATIQLPQAALDGGTPRPLSSASAWMPPLPNSLASAAKNSRRWRSSRNGDRAWNRRAADSAPDPMKACYDTPPFNWVISSRLLTVRRPA